VYLSLCLNGHLKLSVNGRLTAGIINLDIHGMIDLDPTEVEPDDLWPRTILPLGLIPINHGCFLTLTIGRVNEAWRAIFILIILNDNRLR